MTLRTVVVLALLTVITVAAAIAAVVSRPGVATVALDAEPAFPALRDQLDRVAAIDVSAADDRLTITLDADGVWRVAEKDGYPAKTDAVRTLLQGLADMRLVEPKTANPERYARLELEDPEEPSAQSRRVVVRTDGGTVVADAIIGRRVFAATGGQAAGTYVRRGDDQRAWLGSGGMNVQTDAQTWLPRDVLDVAADRIKRITVRARTESGDEGGTGALVRYSVERPEAGADATLIDPPAGRNVAADAVSRLTRAFETVRLSDVAQAGTLNLPEPEHTVMIETFDGLTITLDLATMDATQWATFEVAEADGVADSAEDGDMGSTETAADVSERLSGWVFALPQHIADRLAPSVESLLAPVPEPEPTDGYTPLPEMESGPAGAPN